MDVCMFRANLISSLAAGEVFRFEQKWALRVEIPGDFAGEAKVTQGFIWLEGPQAGQWLPAWNELALSLGDEVGWRVEADEVPDGASPQQVTGIAVGVCNLGPVIRGKAPDGADVPMRVRGSSVFYGIRDGMLKTGVQEPMYLSSWRIVIGQGDGELVVVEKGT